MYDQQSHPLHGLKLDTLLGELVDHYGWEILAEQININCFKMNPSIPASIKFLRRTQWAREKLEAFYLYKFKQYPKPTDQQHELQPRNRQIDQNPLFDTPAVIVEGDGEFFDDPISGPKFPSKKAVQNTREKTKTSSRRSKENLENKDTSKAKDESTSNGKIDPWAKMRD